MPGNFSGVSSKNGFFLALILAITPVNVPGISNPIYANVGGDVIPGTPISVVPYADSGNRGCNSTPPEFTEIPCDSEEGTTTVCGTYGGFFYFGLSYRDTDWYEIHLSNPTAISWCVTGE